MDTRSIGTAPLSLDRVRVGSHIVTLRREYLLPETKTVDVSASESARIAVELTSDQTNPTLSHV